jgi:hypothetical protein
MHEKLIVKNVEGKDKCLFASVGFMPGDAIGYYEGPEVSEDTKHSVRLEGKIIDGTGVLKYAAHSCEPNAYFKDKKRWLIAKENIAAGTEVTIDYLDTEPVITHPFICRCGSFDCRGVIGSFDIEEKKKAAKAGQ